MIILEIQYRFYDIRTNALELVSIELLYHNAHIASQRTNFNIRNSYMIYANDLCISELLGRAFITRAEPCKNIRSFYI